MIEKQIYDLETTYLEESKDFGNVFVGWEAYFAPEKTKTKKTVQNEERLFSLSSVTSPATKKDELSKKKEDKEKKEPKDKEKVGGKRKANQVKKEEEEEENGEESEGLQVEF